MFLFALFSHTLLINQILGLKGPEGDHPKDGQYSWMLLNASSDLNNVATNQMNDEKLCPNFP